MMGFLSISVKPSTILIFSISLGISVDNAIHFLSRYRLHLRLNKWEIKTSVINALRETGFSMIYSSSVLFLASSSLPHRRLGGYGGVRVPYCLYDARSATLQPICPAFVTAFS